MQVFKYLSIFLFSLVVTALISGQKKFIVWNQITDFYEPEIVKINKPYYCKTKIEQIYYQNKSILDFQLHSNLEDQLAACSTELHYPEQYKEPNFIFSYISHLIRSALFLPLVYIATNFNLNMHWLFSIICLFLILGASHNLSSAFITVKQKYLSFYISLAVFSVISLFMNGRFLIAFYASSLFILISQNIFSKKENSQELTKYFLQLACVLILSHISSGVNFIYLILLLLHANLFNPKTKNIKIIFSLLISLQLFFSSVGLVKNYYYFEKLNFSETLTAYINHGVFRQVPLIYLILILLSVAAILSYAFIKLNKYILNPIIAALILFSIGGFFGKSVFFNTLPFIIYLLLFLYYNKALTTNEQLHVHTTT